MLKIATLRGLSGLMVAGFMIGTSARADEGLDVAKRNHCTACHRVDRKLIGPAYLDVAKKYADDAGAEARLVTKVKLGGVGVWGQIPMPPNDKVADEDIKSLVSWILQLQATSETVAAPAAAPIAGTGPVADKKN